MTTTAMSVAVTAMTFAQRQKGEPMRLIDADKLKADVVSWENCYNGFSDTYDKAMIIDTIDEQPTIDAVPVVRCGECEYWTGYCTNGIWQSPTDDYLPQTYADDFCSYGEREGE